jgi:hypothetical protein
VLKTILREVFIFVMAMIVSWIVLAVCDIAAYANHGTSRIDYAIGFLLFYTTSNSLRDHLK